MGNSLYIIAALVAILGFLLLYAFLIPKSTRHFKVGSAKAQEENVALKTLNVIGNDIYAAWPSFFDKRSKTRQKRNPKLESLIRRSGNPWGVSASEFRSFQVLAGFLGFLVSLPLTFLVLVPLSGLPWYVYVVSITLFAFFIPLIKYTEFAKERDLKFKRELPEALDLMTISLSGGHTFDRALKEVIPTLREGLVKQEFMNMVKMINSGNTTHDTLEAFALRAPSDGVLTFVRSVQNALAVNAPMSEILESRAKSSRDEFFALVEQKAAQLESVMMAVLAPTLLPALLITVIAPSINSLMHML